MKRTDPLIISKTLKEAVAESLVNGIFEYISGGGEKGKLVVGNRPSIKFSSGFLEPKYIASNGSQNIDASLNPMHIISAGYDFQVIKNSNKIIEIQPSFSIYIRILPAESDFNGNETPIEYSPEVNRKLTSVKQEIYEKFKSKNEALLKRSKSEYYAALADTQFNECMAVLKNDFGIELHARQKKISAHDSVSEDEKVIASTLPEGEEGLEASDNENIFHSDLAHAAYPNMFSTIPDEYSKAMPPLQKWQRLDISDAPIFKLKINENLQSQIDKANSSLNQHISKVIESWFLETVHAANPQQFPFPKKLKVHPNQIKNWNNTVDDIIKDNATIDKFSLPEIVIAYDIELTKITTRPDIVSLRIALENIKDTKCADQAEFEDSIFQFRLKSVMDNSQYVPYRLDRVKASYRYNEYLHHNAIGYNNGVIVSEGEGNTTFITTWMPIYEQPRIGQINYEDVDITFENLCSSSGVDSLNNIAKNLENWIESTKIKTDPSAGDLNEEEILNENEAFKGDIAAWSLEAKKIQEGVDLLQFSKSHHTNNESSPLGIPYRAWLYMNEAMGMAAKSKKYYSWHLFQIAFILANISGIASRMEQFEDRYDSNWDENVALLYFATGGGKSEAFFGLLIFLLFFDRERGKKFGVSSLIRYPLRLLTIQQAQRLSVTLAFAERVKQKYEIEGEPFSIGFWVGGSNTPNRLVQVSRNQVPVIEPIGQADAKNTEGITEYEIAQEQWNKLPSCPFCKTKTELRSYPAKGGLIGHVCFNTNCTWNLTHSSQNHFQALPFYIVDEDIYDFAPSIVLGTIDKLALLGNHPRTIRKMFGMFGCAPYKNSSTGRLQRAHSKDGFRQLEEDRSCHRLYPFFEEGEKVFFDPLPALIIQDETHLLEESLGTFSGIFETTFECILKKIASTTTFNNVVSKKPGMNDPRMPKIVAATATVTEPERQIHQIFQRDVSQFPYPGPTLYSSFYAEPLERKVEEVSEIDSQDIEKLSHRARIYASIMTNGKPHTSATVDILANFHLLITVLLSKCQNNELVSDQLVNWLPKTPLQSIYKKAIESASRTEISTLLDIHRIALTYVTNKKGGDQIMAAESDVSEKIHIENGITNFGGLTGELISGSVGAGEIQDIIDRAEDRPDIGDDIQDIFDDNLVRSIIATSAISHGVDVDEFNSMFFAGVPTDISEYIQASSRIGRTHVGFVLLIPTPHKRRDRYILEINDIYHRFLERMIRPAAVNRWAESAIIRVLPSLLLSYVITIREIVSQLEMDADRKMQVGDMSRTQNFSSKLLGSNKVGFIKELRDFCNECIGFESEYGISSAEKYQDIIENEIKNVLISEIEKSSDKGVEELTKVFDQLNYKSEKKKRNTMRSLRDVDPAGSIMYESNSNGVSSEEAFNIIRTMRQGFYRR